MATVKNKRMLRRQHLNNWELNNHQSFKQWNHARCNINDNDIGKHICALAMRAGPPCREKLVARWQREYPTVDQRPRYRHAAQTSVFAAVRVSTRKLNMVFPPWLNHGKLLFELFAQYLSGRNNAVETCQDIVDWRVAKVVHRCELQSVDSHGLKMGSWYPSFPATRPQKVVAQCSLT